MRKILKWMGLCMLWLLAMVLCSTAVMKALDRIFSLGYENIWTVGYKVGFSAWLLLLAVFLVHRLKNKDNRQKEET